MDRFNLIKTLQVVLIISLILIAYNVMAGTATIPNSFQSGTPALASEVNDNFSALKTAIDDNSSRSMPVVKDGDGNVLGTLLSNGSWIQTINFITSLNYLAGIDTTIGHIALGTGRFHYTTSDCSGTIYTRMRTQSVQAADIGSGLELFYVPKGSLPQSINHLSNLNLQNGVCDNLTQGPIEVFELFTNDPAETGITDVTYTLPITVEAQ